VTPLTPNSEPGEPTPGTRAVADEPAREGMSTTDATASAATGDKSKPARKPAVGKPPVVRPATRPAAPRPRQAGAARPAAARAAKSSTGEKSGAGTLDEAEPEGSATPSKTAKPTRRVAAKPLVAEPPAAQTAARTNAARTAAAKAESAAQSGSVRAATARSTTEKTTAAKAAAAKSAAAKSATAKSAAAKSAATRATAAKAAAATVAAARAAAAETAAALVSDSGRTVAESARATPGPAVQPIATLDAGSAPAAAPAPAAPARVARAAARNTASVPTAVPAAVPTAVPTTATASMEAPVVIAASGLVKRFGQNVAVSGINLEVRAGSFYGIVGPNGAGKTTTLSMITGLLRPDSGSIQVNGIDVWAKPVEAKRMIGVLPDRLRLFDRLTGAQLLYYSGVLRGLDSETVRVRSADLAAAFGLEDALNRLVADYSAGMTKKIALACAMIHSPRVLVLDEPFESVDPVSAVNVTEILQKYVASGGTVILSSHGMDLIQRVCDYVAIIVHGKVLASGTIDEVRGTKTLEARFVELAGGRKVVEGMEWLHSFSD